MEHLLAMTTDPTAIAADIARYFAIVGAGIPIVWAVSEAIGKATKISEDRVALVMGPLYALFFLAFGWLPVLPVVFEGAEMPINFAWAALAGLGSAGGAKMLNDRLMAKKGWKIPPRRGDAG